MNFKKLLTIGLLTGMLCLAVFSVGYAASFTLTVGSVSAAAGSEAVVPIQIHGASDVGAVQFDLTYDNALLTPVKVEAGSLAANSLVEFNADTPGRLAIGLVRVDPIKGDGELVKVYFKVNAQSGQVIPLSPQNAQAWDGTNLLDIQVKAEPGKITVASPGLSNDMLKWLGLMLAMLCCLGVVFAAIILVVLRRR